MENLTTVFNLDNHIKHNKGEVQALIEAKEGLHIAVSQISQALVDLQGLGMQLRELRVAGNLVLAYTELINSRLNCPQNERVAAYGAPMGGKS